MDDLALEQAKLNTKAVVIGQNLLSQEDSKFDEGDLFPSNQQQQAEQLVGGSIYDSNQQAKDR